MADKVTAAQLSAQITESEKRQIARLEELEKRIVTSVTAQLEQIRVEQAALLTAVNSVSASAPKRVKADAGEKAVAAAAETGDKPVEAPKISTANVMTYWKSSYKGSAEFRDKWNSAEFTAKLAGDDKFQKNPTDFTLAANLLYPLIKNSKELTERAKDELEAYKKSLTAPATQTQGEAEPSSPR